MYNFPDCTVILIATKPRIFWVSFKLHLHSSFFLNLFVVLVALFHYISLLFPILSYYQKKWMTHRLQLRLCSLMLGVFWGTMLSSCPPPPLIQLDFVSYVKSRAILMCLSWFRAHPLNCYALCICNACRALLSWWCWF